MSIKATPLPTQSSPCKILYNPSVAQASTSSSPPPQPNTTPIAHFASVPNTHHPNGSLHAVNQSYIVYGVKNGLIRVLDRRSALRTLLRGHEKRITDMNFFGGGGSSDILGTVGGQPTVGGIVNTDGASNVIIWRVFNREDELASEKLLEIRLKPAVGIVWHPFNPNQFIVLNRKMDPNLMAGSQNNIQDCNGKGTNTTTANDRMTVIATFVETTRLMTVPHEVEGHAVCTCGDMGVSSTSSKEDINGLHHENKEGLEIEGAIKLILPGDWDKVGINYLCWAARDSRHVLTAHKDGYVRLWDLKTLVNLNEDGQEEENSTLDAGVDHEMRKPCAIQSAKCLMEVKVTNDEESGVYGKSVEKCMFLSQYDDAGSFFVSGGVTHLEPGSCMTHPFITCSKGGSCITLWSPFTISGSPPTKVREFQLEHSGTNTTVPRYNITLSTMDTAPPSEKQLQSAKNPPSTYIIIADEVEGEIYALHLSAQWRGASDSSGRKMVAVTGFDHIVPYRAKYPIYSLSVLAPRPEKAAGITDDSQTKLDLLCVQSKAVQLLTLLPDVKDVKQLEEGSSLPAGVKMESIMPLQLKSIVSSANNMPDVIEDGGDAINEDEDDSTVVEDENIEYEDYDDDGVDDDDEYEVVDDNEEDDNEKEDSPVIAPPASALPPPGFGMPGTNSDSNWLGNLVGATAATTDKSALLVPPTPTVTPASTPAVTPSTQKPIYLSSNNTVSDLSKVPLPVVPNVTDSRSSSTTRDSSVSKSQSLLSPMEILLSGSKGIKKESITQKTSGANPNIVPPPPILSSSSEIASTRVVKTESSIPSGKKSVERNRPVKEEKKAPLSNQKDTA